MRTLVVLTSAGSAIPTRSLRLSPKADDHRRRRVRRLALRRNNPDHAYTPTLRSAFPGEAATRNAGERLGAYRIHSGSWVKPLPG